MTSPPSARAMGAYSRSASMMIMSSLVDSATFAMVFFIATDLPEPETPR